MVKHPTEQAAAVRVTRSLGLRTFTADLTTEATRSWLAPADSAISMQCEAKSSVAEAKAVLIFEPELLVPSAAATAAKAAASPATETAACVRAFSTRALSFFLNVQLPNSLLWNHLPIDPLLEFARFLTLQDCKNLQTDQKVLLSQVLHQGYSRARFVSVSSQGLWKSLQQKDSKIWTRTPSARWVFVVEQLMVSLMLLSTHCYLSQLSLSNLLRRSSNPYYQHPPFYLYTYMYL